MMKKAARQNSGNLASGLGGGGNQSLQKLCVLLVN